jgi:hypothetical protein
MNSKPITDLTRGERYTETTYGDGTDETYTLVSIRSSAEGWANVTYRFEDGTKTDMVCAVGIHVFPVPYVDVDQHGNAVAQEGCDRCFCGCKYWELDRCVDCRTHIGTIREAEKLFASVVQAARPIAHILRRSQATEVERALLAVYDTWLAAYLDLTGRDKTRVLDEVTVAVQG